MRNANGTSDTNSTGGDGVEGRLRRIEEALAAIQDTRHMEERVVSRLLDQYTPTAPRALPARSGDRAHVSGRKVGRAHRVILGVGDIKAAGRINADSFRQTCFFDPLAEHAFRRRRTTNVTHADKENG